VKEIPWPGLAFLNAPGEGADWRMILRLDRRPEWLLVATATTA